MLEGTQSGCINHTTVPATARCKQCSRPVCGKCVVVASFGRFCSEACRDQYQDFVNKAEVNESSRKRFSTFRIGPWIRKAVVLLILLGAIGFVASVTRIPVLSPLVRGIRAKFGF